MTTKTELYEFALKRAESEWALLVDTKKVIEAKAQATGASVGFLMAASVAFLPQLRDVGFFGKVCLAVALLLLVLSAFYSMQALRSDTLKSPQTAADVSAEVEGIVQSTTPPETFEPRYIAMLASDLEVWKEGNESLYQVCLSRSIRLKKSQAALASALAAIAVLVVVYVFTTPLGGTR